MENPIIMCSRTSLIRIDYGISEHLFDLTNLNFVDTWRFISAVAV